MIRKIVSNIIPIAILLFTLLLVTIAALFLWEEVNQCSTDIAWKYTDGKLTEERALELTATCLKSCLGSSERMEPVLTAMPSGKKVYLSTNEEKESGGYILWKDATLDNGHRYDYLVYLRKDANRYRCTLSEGH